MTEQTLKPQNSSSQGWLTRVKVGRSSVLTSITIIIVLLPAGLIVLGSHFAYERTVGYFSSQMSEKARLAADLINPDELSKLQDSSDTDNPIYRRVIEPLVVFFQTRPDVRCVHSFRKVSDDQLEYVLDVNTQLDRLGIARVLAPSLIGDPYEGETSFERSVIQNANNLRTTVMNKPIIDDFGTFVGACSPVPDAENPDQQIVCVDFNLDLLNLQIEEIRHFRNLALSLSLLLSGSIGIILWSDRRALIRVNKTLKELSRTDSLTGVYNRRSFFQSMEHELDRVQRYGSTSSLLLIDVDHFKKINDSHGHKAGDIVLVSLTNELKRMVRPTDEIARLGGEEFAILVPESDRGQATLFAERIRHSVENMIVPVNDSESVNLTVSIGIDELQPDTDSVDSVLEKADQYLYAAKAKGRNTIVSD